MKRTRWVLIGLASAVLAGCDGYWLPFVGGCLLGVLVLRCVKSEHPHG